MFNFWMHDPYITLFALQPVSLVHTICENEKLNKASVRE